MTQEVSTDWFKSLWQRVPLLGHLVYCTRKNHAETVKELLITLVFSTATFWISALFFEAFTVNSSATYWSLLFKTVGAGQLFIFAVTFLGPVFLIAGDDPDNAKVFPNRSVHFIALFLLAIVGSGFYALQLGAKEFPKSLDLNADFLLHMSAWIAFLAVGLRYLTVVYRKSTFDPNKELVAPVDHFAERFAAREHQ